MRQIRTYVLELHSEPQGVHMPRRARVLHVHHVGRAKIELYAEVTTDEDTKAFDTNQHQRTFIVLGNVGVIPEGAGLIGADRGWLVFELSRP